MAMVYTAQWWEGQVSVAGVEMDCAMSTVKVDTMAISQHWKYDSSLTEPYDRVYQGETKLIARDMNAFDSVILIC